ncbi:glutamine amidotransferase [Methylobacterium brachiatum]|uniref:glutamine amidotransferase n=1 Tax=Methylobacterium brachiatum TaxID=269660 RepID=UPI000EFA803A|nr:glutamine amidotransferase [Methylobacterium brachiatum]AYO84955.1 glutamine amidotransferase [Methylobacterium brachiatum]
MREAVVIRHVAFEDLAAFADPIEQAGYAIRYRDAGINDLPPEQARGADLLVVLGGPIGADQDDLYPFLRAEREALRDRLAAGAPTLGICLGAQLMAAALGARVAPGPGKEIGWAPVALTDRGRAGPLRHLDHVPVLHWHGDAFDLPPGTERLAATALCPNQAFALGRHALGFQFHPEADGQGFERWLIGHAVEIAATPGASVPALRADARRLGPGAAEAGRRCLAEWLGGLA